MNNIILGLLLINVLFWSFFPHSAHCQLLDGLNKLFNTSMKCSKHSVHLLIGIITYFIALYYSQMDYINNKIF